LKGDYERAETLFRKELYIRQMRFGSDSTIVADSLSNLGECLYLEGKDTEAESKLRQALGIYRRHSTNLGSDARDYLALLFEKKGEYLEATQLLHEAVEIDKRTVGTDNPTYTIHLHNLAGARWRLGDLFTAETKLRESLTTERRVLGDAHPDLGYPLNLLGGVLLEEGDWRKAEPLLRESLALSSKLGQTHLTTSLSNWASVLQAQGKYNDARQYFERALAITQQQPNINAYKATRILSKYALLEFDSGHYSRTEELAGRALKIQRAMRGGETAPDTALTMITLAQARIFQGDGANAEPAARSSYDSQNKTPTGISFRYHCRSEVGGSAHSRRKACRRGADSAKRSRVGLRSTIPHTRVAGWRSRKRARPMFTCARRHTRGTTSITAEPEQAGI
jgi:tetratricopeptide (TPR) repeat protein